MVQWLRLHSPNAGDPGSTTGQVTRSHMPQLRILHVATKTWCSKKKKKKKIQLKIIGQPVATLVLSL